MLGCSVTFFRANLAARSIACMHVNLGLGIVLDNNCSSMDILIKCQVQSYSQLFVAVDVA